LEGDVSDEKVAAENKRRDYTTVVVRDGKRIVCIDEKRNGRRRRVKK
jgi:hypothetical protein